MGGAMLVREAGGQVTELRPDDPALPNIVASGPALHDPLIALLAKAVHKAQNSID
jgi:fructose-1,6-bisphosphatase/inositol monophosphatase family enzyme